MFSSKNKKKINNTKAGNFDEFEGKKIDRKSKEKKK